MTLRVFRAQVTAHHDHEGCTRLLALAREEAREQLATATGLAGEQGMRVVLRDSRDLLAQRTHRLALAGRRGALRERHAALILRTAHRERLLDRAEQLRER